MTHTKFIELLNLYLDHEIDAEEAALLEGEIQSDPERYRLYRQYCRMQKGCSLVAGNFTEASAPILAFSPEQSPRPRSYSGWYAGVGAMAAAACIAFVLVNRPAAQQPDFNVPSAPMVAKATPPKVTRQSNQAPTFSMPEFATSSQGLQTVFTPKLINTPETAESARAFFARESADQFNWMNRPQLNPLDTREMIFRLEPATDQRTYRSHRPMEGQVEMTAFQFQR